MKHLFLQYGRKDIEYARKNKIKPNKSNEEDGNYSINISKDNKPVKELKYTTKRNGIKNGMSNDTSQVINRDNDLILVPEPINKLTDHEKINENKVSIIVSLKLIKYTLHDIILSP